MPSVTTLHAVCFVRPLDLHVPPAAINATPKLPVSASVSAAWPPTVASCHGQTLPDRAHRPSMLSEQHLACSSKRRQHIVRRVYTWLVFLLGNGCRIALGRCRSMPCRDQPAGPAARPLSRTQPALSRRRWRRRGAGWRPEHQPKSLHRAPGPPHCACP